MPGRTHAKSKTPDPFESFDPFDSFDYDRNAGRNWLGGRAVDQGTCDHEPPAKVWSAAMWLLDNDANAERSSRRPSAE